MINKEKLLIKARKNNKEYNLELLVKAHKITCVCPETREPHKDRDGSVGLATAKKQARVTRE